MMKSLRSFFFAAFLGLLLSACGGGDGSDSAQEVIDRIESATLAAVTDVRAEFSALSLSLRDLPPRFSPSLGGTSASVKDRWLDLLGGLQDKFLYTEVRTYRITYTVPGHNEPLSGLLAVPSDPDPQKVLNLPMISLQHPTQVLRSQSPSLVSLFEDEQLTVPFGTMLAAMGYIVVIPDYPGLGINREPHPYGLLSIGPSVSGLVGVAGGAGQPWSSRAAWDGRLFLIGFSEGGYASLAAARDIEMNRPGIDLAGVAALDGPYSLSETMRGLMLGADASFAAPYFLPYAVAAYGSAYGGRVPLLRFENAVLATPGADPLNAKLSSMLSGAFTSEEIDGAMRQAAPYSGPSSILTPEYRSALENTQSDLYRALRENDAFRGWTPAAKVLLYHNIDDDLVPVGNLDQVRQAWGVSLPNVTYETPDADLPGMGSVHAGAMIPAYIRGASWIHGLAYP